MSNLASADAYGALVRARRSVRDFLPAPIPPALLDAVIADAAQSPSWSNTQPWRLAVASGALTIQLREQLLARYDAGTRAARGGWLAKLRLLLAGGAPDGDFKVNLPYPPELVPARRATGFGLYKVLGIARDDYAARDAQMRRNFAFFDAPTVIFFFAHGGLKQFAALDTGIAMQTLMLSAQAHGLATCAQGALATWAGPVRDAFAVPPGYQLIAGMAIGYASDHPVNAYNPGRAAPADLLLPQRG